jgi:hypothetical protein
VSATKKKSSTRARGRKSQDVSLTLSELRAAVSRVMKVTDELSTDRRLTSEMRGQMRELANAIANHEYLLIPLVGHRVYVRRKGVRS